MAARRMPVMTPAVLVVLCIGGAAVANEQPSPPGVRRELLDDSHDVTVTRVDGSVYAVTQDDGGYLWLGGDAGAIRYDGADLVTHGPGQHAAFRTPQAFRLAAGGGARLWAGLAGGLFRVDRDGRGASVVVVEEHARGGELLRFDGRRWTRAPVDDGVWALAPDGARALWAGGERGLWRLEAGAVVEHVGTAQGLPAPHVLSVLVARDGTPWAGTTKGLARRLGGRFERVPSGHTPPAIFALTQDAGGAIWAGTAVGLARVDAGGAFMLVPDATAGLAYPWVEAVAATPDGAVWAATRSGLVRLQAGRRSVFGRHNGLPDDQVLALHVDRSGVLWAGTRHAGVARIAPRRVQNLGAPEGLPGRDARAILRARDGAMWVSAEGGLMRIARDGEKEVHRRGRELPDRAPGAMAEDASGTLWVAAGPGELLCAPAGARAWRRVPLAAGAEPRAARVLAFDRQGQMWMGFEGGGGARADATVCAAGATVEARGTFALTPPCRGVVVDLAPDAAWVWAAVDGAGIARVSADGGVTCHGLEAGLPTTNVGSVLVDRTGGVWAGLLFDAGVHLLSSGRFGGLAEGRGLSCDSIAKVVDDERGHLWAACAAGATRVSLADAAAVATGRLAEALPIPFGAGDGMRSQRVRTGAQPVAALDAGGALWVATDAGVSILLPPDGAPGGAAAEVLSLEIDGRPVDVHQGRATAPSGALRVRYTAPVLGPPRRGAFRYRLEPLDADWEITVGRRVAAYPRLGPGAYRFRVQAADGRGGFSTAEAVVALRVVQVWYRRPGVPVAAGLLVVAAAVVLVRLRTRRLHARVRLIEEERARVARDLHDGLGQALAAVTLNLETAALGLGDGAAPAVRAALASARAFLRHGREEVRQAIWNLRARQEPRPLAPALEAALAELKKAAPSGPEVALVIAPDAPVPPPGLVGDLVLVVTEAVWNALRHARATRIEVRVAREGDDRLKTTIMDDGVGFVPDLEALVLRGHFGLFGIRERARLAGGTFDVAAGTAGGSVVSAVFPLRPPREALAR